LPVPHQLVQGGLAAALRGLVERDFANDFQRVDWQIDPQAVAYARGLPLFVNEVIFFAARELLRNASVHGRGKNRAAELHLKIGFALAENFCLTIEDDGIGFRLEPHSSLADKDHSSSGTSSSGAGTGIRIHSTMLATVGARLEVLPLPEKGTRAVILVSKPYKKY
jgi:signal transduction histidine kinase